MTREEYKVELDKWLNVANFADGGIWRIIEDMIAYKNADDDIDIDRIRYSQWLTRKWLNYVINQSIQDHHFDIDYDDTLREHLIEYWEIGATLAGVVPGWARLNVSYQIAEMTLTGQLR